MTTTETFITPATARGKRLAKAGYRIVREVRTNKGNRWYEVITPGDMPAVVGYQSAHCIHVFYTFEGTASGTSEARACDGGLGDAIDTDAQLRGYRKLVRNAPESLMRKYDGLYRASSDAFNG